MLEFHWVVESFIAKMIHWGGHTYLSSLKIKDVPLLLGLCDISNIIPILLFFTLKNRDSAVDFLTNKGSKA